MSAQIIKFPSQKIVRKVTAKQEKMVQEVSTKMDVEVILDHVGSEIVEMLYHYGYPIGDDQKTTRDLLMIYDILRAIIYRNHGLPHHLHNFLDNSLTMKPLSELIPSMFPDSYDVSEITVEDQEEMARLIDALLGDMEVTANTPYNDWPSDTEPPTGKRPLDK